VNLRKIRQGEVVENEKLFLKNIDLLQSKKG